MEPMTISQALRRIAKLKGTFKEQTDRAATSVNYEVNNMPAFTFGSSMEQADAACKELIAVETALRIANARTKVDFRGRSMTLAEATCVLRETKSRIAWLRALAVLPQAEVSRTKVEWDEACSKQVNVKYLLKSELPEVKRAERVQEAQETFDALNDLVETTNHHTLLAADK